MLPELKKADPVEARPGVADSAALPVSESAGTAALLGWLALRVARTVETGGQAFWVLTATLAAYLLADLVSGIVHWMGDTLGDENAGWFGAAFSQPFREHHKDPRAIAIHAFVETNGNNGIVALPPLVAAHLWMTESGWRFYMAAFIGALAFFGLATNQCHKWAHSLTVPRVVLWLQRWHLIIAPDHHDQHHEWPHRTHYCVLSGWMNTVADRLKFFRAVELIIRHTRPSWLATGSEAAVAPPGSPPP